MQLITTCNNCGSSFQWEDTYWNGLGMPDCPSCGFNNQTGKIGKKEGPIECGYRKLAQQYREVWGELRSVEYLSHFPKFEINFNFEKSTVYSGARQGKYDINFLSLGYYGEGPKYARAFMDELGFSLTADEIANITPGAVLTVEDGKVIIKYKAG